MLEWANPLWFWAAPVALLPLFGELRPWSLRFSSLHLVEARWTPRRLVGWLPALLRALAILGVVTALARPQAVERESYRESDGVDILLAIDTSASMEAPDMGGEGSSLSRLEAGKRVMASFVDGRSADRVGLLAFGEGAFVQVPLTLDHAALQDFISQLDIGTAGKRATAVGDAIAIAAKRMKELEAPSKVVILVTDGRSTTGQVDPIQAAHAAAALGVKVYTIGVGSTSGSGRGILGALFGSPGADVDEPTLREIAGLTHARYWRATDAAALAQVYAAIDELEKSPAKIKEFVHREELYRRVLWPSIAVFVAEVLLSGLWLRRLP